MVNSTNSVELIYQMFDNSKEINTKFLALGFRNELNFNFT